MTDCVLYAGFASAPVGFRPALSGFDFSTLDLLLSFRWHLDYLSRLVFLVLAFTLDFVSVSISSL